ncbi:hypothetical protein MAC_06188 [Metarhizium acridum CQMa 102]|uniref:Uncharacterized protein n=1 Tax=Metarhizium acridum (strain CQMa 102) TaxID=655827 RepID=E9E8J0_METAQ|nr:uncharacterized protein MAC_06188 [Metarhizium acridum CQMa 102]EFY87821.1 hypothetical protein MAC_06188 [Metarhizium acridum CQMa 102]
MPSAQDIASKLAYITGQLTAGGTNAQMKAWYDEYKKLNVELKEAKAMQKKNPKDPNDLQDPKDLNDPKDPKAT